MGRKSKEDPTRIIRSTKEQIGKLSVEIGYDDKNKQWWFIDNGVKVSGFSAKMQIVTFLKRTSESGIKLPKPKAVKEYVAPPKVEEPVPVLKKRGRPIGSKSKA
jgi:hypothetical protein